MIIIQHSNNHSQHKPSADRDKDRAALSPGGSCAHISAFHKEGKPLNSSIHKEEKPLNSLFLWVGATFAGLYVFNYFSDGSVLQIR